jgi:hypothetical protein
LSIVWELLQANIPGQPHWKLNKNSLQTSPKVNLSVLIYQINLVKTLKWKKAGTVTWRDWKSKSIKRRILRSIHWFYQWTIKLILHQYLMIEFWRQMMTSFKIPITWIEHLILNKTRNPKDWIIFICKRTKLSNHCLIIIGSSRWFWRSNNFAKKIKWWKSWDQAIILQQFLKIKTKT